MVNIIIVIISISVLSLSIYAIIKVRKEFFQNQECTLRCMNIHCQSLSYECSNECQRVCLGKGSGGQQPSLKGGVF